MADAPAPWLFRYRVAISGLLYSGGFVVGYALQDRLFGNIVPTFVIIGRHWGRAGVETVAIIAALFVASGYGLRLWGSSYHSPGVVLSGALVTSRLTAAGPYRYLRNPLYLGSIFQAIGISMLGAPIATLLVTIVIIAYSFVLIAIEERYLLATQGDAYRRYCAAVPRLIPRISPPDLPDDATRPSWIAGFRTELFSLAFLLTMIFFVVSVYASWPFYYVAWAFWFIAIAVSIYSAFLRRRPPESASQS